MRYTTLGKSGLKVSRFCLGAMTFGQDGWGCDEPEADQILGTFVEAGGNFVDTANIYGSGQSEAILGRIMRGRRHDIVIATKFGGRTGAGANDEGSSRRNILRAVDDSLRRLGTDYIDLYQAHHYDEATPIGETLETLHDLIKAGKVRYAGCSNYHAWQLADADHVGARDGSTRFASCQMMYSLARRDLEREHIPVIERLGLGLLVYSPLHSGLLTGAIDRNQQAPARARIAAHPLIRQVYLDDEERIWQVVEEVRSAAEAAGCSMTDVALGWLLRQPAVTSILLGPQTPEQLRANLATVNSVITPEIWDRLDAATRPPATYPSDFYSRMKRRSEITGR